MAVDQSTINADIREIRENPYGKNVISATADAIDNCLTYAMTNPAIAESNTILDEIEENTEKVDRFRKNATDLKNAAGKLNKIIVSSNTTPSDPETKIWIKPQADTEYKIASFDSFLSLWNLVDEMNDTYSNGHGGVVSIYVDEAYVDETEIDVPESNRQIKRLVITYSDGHTDRVLFPECVGQSETIVENGSVIEYSKGEVDGDGSLITTPPSNIFWETTIPELSPGDYLWSRTTNVFKSGNVNAIYSVGRLGNDGVVRVTSIKIGDSENTQSSNVELPVDDHPITGNTKRFIYSDAVYSAIEEYKNNTSFVGSPTVPTPPKGNDSSVIATTEFVDRLVLDDEIAKNAILTNSHLTGVPTVPTIYTPRYWAASGIHNTFLSYGDLSKRIASARFVSGRSLELLYKKFRFGIDKNPRNSDYTIALKSDDGYSYGCYYETANIDEIHDYFSITVPEHSSHAVIVFSSHLVYDGFVFIAGRGDGPVVAFNLIGKNFFRLNNNYGNQNGVIRLDFGSSLFEYYAHHTMIIVDFVFAGWGDSEASIDHKIVVNS